MFRPYFVIPVILLVVALAVSSEFYTVNSDRSWATWSSNLEYPSKQLEYEQFMQGCRAAAGPSDADRLCDKAEESRLQQNMYQPRSVYNYTQTGFLHIRAPEKVFSLINEFWQNNRNNQSVEWDMVTPFHNVWVAPPTILRIQNETLIGGGEYLSTAIANAAQEAIEEWTGVPQVSTSVYGIRVYHNQSILTPHCDRFPLISSAIINVDQSVTEPWILEVFDHQSVAHNITMKPGDMVLYESHSVIHGRPYPLNGDFYANVFIHFEALGSPKVQQSNGQLAKQNDLSLPPYIIPNSSWAPEWEEANPDGWMQVKDPVAMAGQNNLNALRYLGSVNASMLLDEDDHTSAKWKPIHEAARMGFVDIVRYLIEELGANPNEPCAVTGFPTPLAIAKHFKGDDDPVVSYLESVGGTIYVDEANPNEEL